MMNLTEHFSVILRKLHHPNLLDVSLVEGYCGARV
jgi:hypothetical protein